MIGNLMDTEAVIVTTGDTGETDPLDRPIVGEIAHTPTVARFEQTGSVEGTEYVRDKWIGYFPGDAVIGADDEIIDLTVNRRFKVDGSPAHQRIPGFPVMDHVLAHLTFTGEGR